MRYVRNVLDVFFGSVRRAQWSMAGGVFIFAAARPDLAERYIQTALAAIWRGIEPFAGAAITLLIIAVGFSLMLKPLFGGKKNRH